MSSSTENGPPVGRSASGLDAAFGDSLWCYLVALGLLAVVDTLLALVRSGDSVLLLGHYLAVTVACGSWLALVLCAPTSAGVFVARRWKGLRRAPEFVQVLVATTVSCVTASVVCVLLIRPWNIGVVWPYYVVPGMSLVAALALALVEHFPPERVRRSVYVVLGLLVFAVDAFAYRRLYPTLHSVLFFVAILLIARGAAFRNALSVKSRVGAATAALVLAHVTLFGDLTSVRHLGVWFGTVQPKTLAFVHTVIDRDGDGHSAVFGGGDCDDQDAAVHPGACESERSGRDDNCNGLVSGSTHHQASASWTPGSSRRADVYFVMVDTLRGDFGRVARRDVAPEVDAFARSALDFVRAYTPYPSTFRAMLSVGRSRSWRGIGGGGAELLGQMAALGYDARLWIDTRQYKRARSGGPILHLDRSKGDPFRLKSHHNKSEWSEAIVDRAIAELGVSTQTPRFRWLHLLDPHAPLVRGQGAPLEMYRAEVGHVSHLFGRLLEALAKSHRGRRAVVILLSDHGDEFGDHGGRFHGATLYEENIWVPLMMRLPGVAPAKVEQVASLLDVVPTLMDYLGQPPLPTWQGHSWLRPVPAERPVFSQVEPVANLGGQGRPEMHAVVLGRYKLVHNVTRNLFELYDIKDDPSERSSLVSSKPEEAARLRQVLARWQDDPICQSF